MSNTAVPGHYRRDFKAIVTDIARTQIKGDDGRLHHELALTHETNYIGRLDRVEGRFTLLVEWVDPNGDGHRFSVPHEVVAAIINVHKRIMVESKSDRAKRAADTRKLNQLTEEEIA